MLLARLAPRTARGLLALVAAAAVVVSSPGMPSATAAAEPDSPSEVRALWVLRTSLASPESIASLVRSARDHGVQHLARPGARPRRRLLQRRHRAARRGAPAPAGQLRSARNRPHLSARGGPSGARLGQRQPGVERGRSADRARAPRLSPPRVADGAARHRPGRRQGRRPTALPTSASSRAGHARRLASSKGSTPRRSPRPPPTTFRPSCAT